MAAGSGRAVVQQEDGSGIFYFHYKGGHKLIRNKLKYLKIFINKYISFGLSQDIIYLYHGLDRNTDNIIYIYIITYAYLFWIRNSNSDHEKLIWMLRCKDHHNPMECCCTFRRRQLLPQVNGDVGIVAAEEDDNGLTG